MKVILFGFDGLRPDMVSAESMPNLSEFLENGVRYSDARAVFPTETYVNHPSIFTGFLPERHGLIANAYFDTTVSRKDFFLGSWVDRIESAEEKTDGQLFQVPTITDVLASEGRRYLSISSNSPGSTRLMAHKAASNKGINISVNGFSHAHPEKLRDCYGPDPKEELEKPDLKGLRTMNRIVRDLVDADGLPDLSIVWYGEPDHSFHSFGLVSAESAECLSVADECFAELLDLYGKSDDVQVVVASDHGHITVKEHFDLTAALVDAGFRHGENLDSPEADFSLLWGYSGNIYLRNQALLAEMTAVLQSMDEIGMLFSRHRSGSEGLAPGTFSSRLVAGDHYRAGDIRFVLRAFDENGPGGLPGTCNCAAPIAVGCGIHGGLHPGELRTVLGWGGSRFHRGLNVGQPAGVIDIAPTIYRLLNLEPKLKPQGRVLEEAFVGGSSQHLQSMQQHYKVSQGSFSQELTTDVVNGIPYFHSGGRAS